MILFEKNAPGVQSRPGLADCCEDHLLRVTWKITYTKHSEDCDFDEVPEPKTQKEFLEIPDGLKKCIGTDINGDSRFELFYNYDTRICEECDQREIFRIAKIKVVERPESFPKTRGRGYLKRW
jgi:hypothetical protein